MALLYMVIRQKRNHIEAHKDDKGSQVTNEEHLRDMTKRYLRNLYSNNEQVLAESFPLKNSFPKLSDKCLEDLQVCFTSEKNEVVLLEEYAHEHDQWLILASTWERLSTIP